MQIRIGNESFDVKEKLKLGDIEKLGTLPDDLDNVYSLAKTGFLTKMLSVAGVKNPADIDFEDIFLFILSPKGKHWWENLLIDPKKLQMSLSQQTQTSSDSLPSPSVMSPSTELTQ